jgi:replicative DNA helicase
MSREQLVDRLISAQSGVDAWRLRTGQLREEDFVKIGDAMNRLAEANLYIDDTASMTSLEMRTKARRLQAEKGLDLVIVDYLQLMESSRRSDNRVQEISEISRSLKALAKELDAPVLALSQLSRAVEQRTSRVPQLSDLRESGSIEQDADIVMFIYREEYYDRETVEKNLADIIISKHRNGPLGTSQLYFRPERMVFENLEKRREVDTL